MERGKEVTGLVGEAQRGRRQKLTPTGEGTESFSLLLVKQVAVQQGVSREREGGRSGAGPSGWQEGWCRPRQVVSGVPR